MLILGLFFSSSGQKTDSLPLYKLDSLVVIAHTPLADFSGPDSKVANAIYQLTVPLKRYPGKFSLEQIDDHIGPVFLNNAGGNGRQSSLNFRGFQAAPLLGFSQGLSVYLDGVRMNDLFGDVVHWDMIPSNGIKKIELTPGSNALFGLNTLGGALNYQTRSGFDSKRHFLGISNGAFGLWEVDMESSQQFGKIAYTVGGEFFSEQGWRDFSPSQTMHLFNKLGYKHALGSSNVSIHLGRGRLRGNGAVPQELLMTDRSAVYTHPDEVKNKMSLISLNHQGNLGSGRIWGLVYYKRRGSDTFNGDESIYEPCQGSSEGYLCSEEEEEIVTDQSNNPVPALEQYSSAVNNITETKENGIGITLQYDLTVKSHLLSAGLAFNGGRSNFKSGTEFAHLTSERSTIGSGLYDQEQFVDLMVDAQNWGLFLDDRLSLFNDLMHLQVGLGMNHTQVKLNDQIGQSLNGNHTYFTFNPFLGASLKLSKNGNLFFNFGISNRAPTPVELTCASPDDPCRLPNSFIADPPLDQVTAVSNNVGWRGRYTLGWYQLNFYHITVLNDLYFVSAGPGRNSGYFTNLENTIRTGVEVMATLNHRKWEAQFSYTFLEAVFGEDFMLLSPLHPQSSDGEILVKAGNTMPMLPKHLLKVTLEWLPLPKLQLLLTYKFQSNRLYQGDESNTLNSSLGGYHLISQNVRFKFADWLFAFGEFNNLLDIKYETYGMLAEPDQLPEFEQYQQPFFLTPGVPRTFKVGLQLLIE